MVRTEIYLCVLLGHLLIEDSGATCVAVECLRCNVTGETLTDSCSLCLNNSQCIDGANIPPNCRKDFRVSVNSTGSSVEEGRDITLTCLHELPVVNLMFQWKKDGKEIEGQNKTKLFLENVMSSKAGKYICAVNSTCGSYESLPHDVTVNNNSLIILVICGVSALALVLIMGLVMKLKLKRDNAKHKERMRQKAEAEQRGGPAPFTPREN